MPRHAVVDVLSRLRRRGKLVHVENEGQVPLRARRVAPEEDLHLFLLATGANARWLVTADRKVLGCGAGDLCVPLVEVVSSRWVLERVARPMVPCV